MDGNSRDSVEKLFTNSVNFQDMRHTGDNRVQKLLSSPQQDKTPERQALGHRMISTRCYRPGEEHALSCMEKTASGGRKQTIYSRPECQESLNLINL